MKYLVAVSGGIDSVVLLDMLARRGNHKLTVAHFDHGIRPDSAADARFVKALADKYNLPFVSRREELGPSASEESARRQRYAFLREEAKKIDGTIATAHHLDDALETIAINIYRGTGWRGVAVMDDETIARPLLDFTKADLYHYALNHRLEWVEDSTNTSLKYLRNRVRRRMHLLTQKAELADIWQAQRRLVRTIEAQSALFLQNNHEYSRHFFTMLDEIVGRELLRAAIVKVTGKSPLAEQCERALLAIKVAKPSTTIDVGSGVSLSFTARHFIVVPPQKVL